MRNESGNMSAMVALVGGIIIIVVVAGVLVMYLFLSHQRQRTDADESALTLAHVLNNRDRLGQMNTLVERSRELVYISRSNYQESAREEGYTNLEDLSRVLLEEARTGAQYVERGRSVLADVVVSDLKLSGRELRDKLNGERKNTLAWMSTASPKLVSLEAGYTRGVPSNVVAAEALDVLKQLDKQTGYLDPSGRIFNGNVNARLPAPDNDLDFKISSLPSPVGIASSPPRLTDDSVFKPWVVVSNDDKGITATPEQLPSAVRVRLEMPVTVKGVVELNNKIRSNASAEAGGALPPPDEAKAAP